MSAVGLPPGYRTVVVALSIALAAALAQQQPAQRPVAAAADSGKYVNPSVCATCHAAIADSFAKTGMGRSFQRLQAQNAVEDFGKPFYHAASDTYLEMIERGGKPQTKLSARDRPEYSSAIAAGLLFGEQ